MAERSYTFEQLYGSEHPAIDGKPVAIPAGFKRPETLAEQVQRLVRNHLSRQAEEQGFESFDEANDFDIPDDPVDPNTPFEEFFDPALGRSITPDEFRRFETQYRKEYLKAQADKIAADDRYEALKAHVAELRAKKAKKPPEGGGVTPPPSPASRG